MVDVVMGYDVEDVYNEASDDALLTLCHIHSEEGVPASMFVAGEKARVMRERGRRDALDALAEHEICYHGNYWGDFPEPATSYGARLDFDEAVEFALHVEARGLHDVAEITGQFPVAWCCHQAQQSLPMQYAMKLAGVRCWAGGPRGWIMNWLSWPRSNCTVSSQGAWNARRRQVSRRSRSRPASGAGGFRAACRDDRLHQLRGAPGLLGDARVGRAVGIRDALSPRDRGRIPAPTHTRARPPANCRGQRRGIRVHPQTAALAEDPRRREPDHVCGVV
jgi:hypothetical protein